MRTIHFFVFACFSILTESRYFFRFHTCHEEDQQLLENEKVLSLRQFVYIDDGAITNFDYVKMKTFGLEINDGSVMDQFNQHFKPGGEAAHNVISIGSHSLILNFWSHTYYGIEGNYSFVGSNMPIKPYQNHFVRVYFICSPGTSRSALIIFGTELVENRIKKDTGKKKKEFEERLESKKNDADWEEQKDLQKSIRVRLVISYIIYGINLSIFLNLMILFFFVAFCGLKIPPLDSKIEDDLNELDTNK